MECMLCYYEAIYTYYLPFYLIILKHMPRKLQNYKELLELGWKSHVCNTMKLLILEETDSNKMFKRALRSKCNK